MPFLHSKMLFLCVVLASRTFISTMAATTSTQQQKDKPSSMTSTNETVKHDIRHINDFLQFSGNTSDSPVSNNQQLLNPTKQHTGGVTIYPSSNLARSTGPISNHSQITFLSALSEIPKGPVLQSSFSNPGTDQNITSIYPSTNGFIRSAIDGYSSHHHLILRPEDIWFAILTQFSSYINAHASDLRSTFVSHEGQKELQIVYDDPEQLDWAHFATNIGVMIQDNVLDPDLRAWIVPNFSTTMAEDSVVANIILMGTVKEQFSYTSALTCGLPSITLLGEPSDYENILARIDTLRSGRYGSEAAHFARLLTPVLRNFISFDDPARGQDEVKSFWNRIVTAYDLGSRPTYYFGWITAFAFWNDEGHCSYPEHDWRDELLPSPPLELDGVKYHIVESDDIPYGWVTVPVKIVEYGVEKMAEMLAGSVGMEASASGGEMEVREGGMGNWDTLQPKSGWFIYEKSSEEAPRPEQDFDWDSDWYG